MSDAVLVNSEEMGGAEALFFEQWLALRAYKKFFLLALFSATVSGLLVASTVHKSRALIAELAQGNQRLFDLHLEGNKLLLENSVYGSLPSVQDKVLRDLDMMSPSNKDIVVIKP